MKIGWQSQASMYDSQFNTLCIADVVGSELVVKIVNVQDMTIVKCLREQTQGAKHVSFDPSGRYVAVSCLDGIIYVYSFIDPNLKLEKRIDGIIRKLEPGSEITSQVCWHPDGRAFAAVEATKDIAVVSTSDWTKKNIFTGGHTADITAICWSPNGAFLTTASADGSIILWETATQAIIKRYLIPSVIKIIWHPTDNILSFTTSDGELFIYEDFVPPERRILLNKTLENAPLEKEANENQISLPERPPPRPLDRTDSSRKRAGTPDSLDDILGPASDDEQVDDFIEDDDGAGYVEAVGKRQRGDEDIDGPASKRRIGMFWEPKRHESFQPGSTPWRGDRRYLCKSQTFWLYLAGDIH